MKSRLILAGLVLILLVAAFFLPRVAVVERDGGPYGRILLAEPQRKATAYVQIYFGPKDWDGQGRDMLRALAGRGAIAVGVNTNIYLDRIARGAPKCLNLLGDAETLSKLIQRERAGADYYPPLLAGAGPGGTAALLALSQAMPNTFAGAVTIDPAAKLDTRGAGLRGCARPSSSEKDSSMRRRASSMVSGRWAKRRALRRTTRRRSGNGPAPALPRRAWRWLPAKLTANWSA